MGIDVNLHLNPEVGVAEVVDYMRASGYQNVEVQTNYKIHPTYFNIFFTVDGGYRMMHFHCGMGIFGSHKISIGAFGCAWDLVQDIAETFGGIAIPNDCEGGNAVVYDDNSAKMNKGSAVFLIKWGISNGIIDGSSVEDATTAKKAFDEMIGRKT